MHITTELSYELTAGEWDRFPVILNTLITMHGIESVHELDADLVKKVWGSDANRVYQGGSGKCVQENDDTTSTRVTIYVPR